MKYSIKLRLLTLLAVAGGIWASCNEIAEQQAFIQPTLPKADVPYKTSEMMAETGGVIKLPNGSSIEIPANAFVDKNGTPIKGKVEIDYREFHDAASVLASGIPMTFTSNGQVEHFKTAGMFDIRGYVQGVAKAQIGGGAGGTRTKIYVAPGAELSVNVASFTGDDGYSFYAFNEETKTWETKGTSTPVPNAEKMAKMDAEAVSPEPIAMPKPFDAKQPAFELDINVKEFPEFANMQGILWQYAGEDASKDPAKSENAWMATTQWSEMSIVAAEIQGNYLLKLKNAKQAVNLEVKPVLRGKNYEKVMAGFEEKLTKYNADKTKRLEVEERYAAEGNFLRMARVHGFGLYNHDAFYRGENPMACQASFSLSDGSVLAENAAVYIVAGEQRVLIKTMKDGYDNWKNFTYSVGDAAIVAVLEGGKLATMSRSVLEGEKVEHGKPHTFTLKVNEQVESSDALASAIRNLW